MVHVTCPNCGMEFEDDPDDIQESEQYEVECPECEKVFGYTISISITAYEHVLPCGGQFGEGQHEWKPVIGFPEEYYRNMFCCRHCGLVKTIEEKK